ncbi:hypothetical protein D5R81_01920 [Parashewanella spongiae]|uniref:Uncharacterized protein n=1 Tax=Parashewanella spongiae TaxID=342950 RepID=A0A3A6U161_9GAMM|nr:hypothetical protein [Parashewanella spongiae]RJY19133.1 hypothetical protein D5R81_01920 [Parashewanella spongiae]
MAISGVNQQAVEYEAWPDIAPSVPPKPHKPLTTSKTECSIQEATDSEPIKSKIQDDGHVAAFQPLDTTVDLYDKCHPHALVVGGQTYVELYKQRRFSRYYTQALSISKAFKTFVDDMNNPDSSLKEKPTASVLTKQMRAVRLLGEIQELKVLYGQYLERFSDEVTWLKAIRKANTSTPSSKALIKMHTKVAHCTVVIFAKLCTTVNYKKILSELFCEQLLDSNSVIKKADLPEKTIMRQSLKGSNFCQNLLFHCEISQLFFRLLEDDNNHNLSKEFFISHIECVTNFSAIFWDIEVGGAEMALKKQLEPFTSSRKQYEALFQSFEHYVLGDENLLDNPQHKKINMSCDYLIFTALFREPIHAAPCLKLMYEHLPSMSHRQINCLRRGLIFLCNSICDTHEKFEKSTLPWKFHLHALSSLLIRDELKLGNSKEGNHQEFSKTVKRFEQAIAPATIESCPNFPHLPVMSTEKYQLPPSFSIEFKSLSISDCIPHFKSQAYKGYFGTIFDWFIKEVSKEEVDYGRLNVYLSLKNTAFNGHQTELQSYSEAARCYIEQIFGEYQNINKLKYGSNDDLAKKKVTASKAWLNKVDELMENYESYLLKISGQRMLRIADEHKIQGKARNKIFNRCKQSFDKHATLSELGFLRDIYQLKMSFSETQEMFILELLIKAKTTQQIQQFDNKMSEFYTRKQKLFYRACGFRFISITKCQKKSDTAFLSKTMLELGRDLCLLYSGFYEALERITCLKLHGDVVAVKVKLALEGIVNDPTLIDFTVKTLDCMHKSFQLSAPLLQQIYILEILYRPTTLIESLKQLDQLDFKACGIPREFSLLSVLRRIVVLTVEQCASSKLPASVVDINRQEDFFKIVFHSLQCGWLSNVYLQAVKTVSDKELDFARYDLFAVFESNKEKVRSISQEYLHIQTQKKQQKDSEMSALSNIPKAMKIKPVKQHFTPATRDLTVEERHSPIPPERSKEDQLLEPIEKFSLENPKQAIQKFLELIAKNTHDLQLCIRGRVGIVEAAIYMIPKELKQLTTYQKKLETFCNMLIKANEKHPFKPDDLQLFSHIKEGCLVMVSELPEKFFKDLSEIQIQLMGAADIAIKDDEAYTSAYITMDRVGKAKMEIQAFLHFCETAQTAISLRKKNTQLRTPIIKQGDRFGRDWIPKSEREKSAQIFLSAEENVTRLKHQLSEISVLLSFS